jgi:hypothetical protein
MLAAGDPDGDSYSRLNRMLEGKGARGGEAEGEGREGEALEVLEMGRGKAREEGSRISGLSSSSISI